MNGDSMSSNGDKTVFVAGATGNVGPFVVQALLERGATVAVSSRSEGKLRELREHLTDLGTDLDRLHSFQGELGDGDGAAALRTRIRGEAGAPSAVVASIGDFVSTPAVLHAGHDDLKRAVDAYLLANFSVARTFLPDLSDSGGAFVFLQGPLAFELYPGYDAHLISIATAAQHMLFRALAQELDESPAHVVELVTHAYVRNRQTQPGSPLTGEQVGAFVAHLVAGAAETERGKSIELRAPEQLEEAGVGVPAHSSGGN
jgi:NAD(P)-dependent dehydrogenase (short-subunit alcohol dehydrogenase family)